jgi:hypothetical protein
MNIKNIIICVINIIIFIIINIINKIINKFEKILLLILKNIIFCIIIFYNILYKNKKVIPSRSAGIQLIDIFSVH